MIDFANVHPVTVTLEPTESVIAVNAVSLVSAIMSGDKGASSAIFDALFHQIAAIGAGNVNALVQKLGAAAKEAIPGVPVSHHGATENATPPTPPFKGGIVS